MRFSDQLQLPVEWPDSGFSLREKMSTALLSAIGCGGVLVGIAGGLGGQPAALRYGLAYGFLVLLVAVFGVLLKRSGAHETVRSAPIGSGQRSATEIRQSRRLWSVLVALTACCTAVTAGPAIEIYLNAPTSGIPGASVVLGVLGSVFASFLVLVVSGLIRPGSVEFTPDGIRHRGWSFESFLPWESVAGVKPAYNGHRMILLIGFANAQWTSRYTTPVWRIDKLPPVPMIELDCRKFAMQDVLLFHFVSFYASNPAMRVELGTDAARARFEARDFS
ncbi:hypothetical protein [Rhodococcus xishaensis]|uniref:PH domain-containing protein n=1 Tax=Rhodococcus xishaensis TaxID=2487364 RepID=A0A3S3A5R1_9NOCA|nr:hypothetical protein [Rhodococcus xishaensis]RVW02688.1 hypothetical protein EGT50_07925 [Rhodococcus xishaensis]